MLLLLVLVLAGVYYLRVKRLYTNSRGLFAISDQFPRDYYVGVPSSPPLSYLALGDSITQGSGVQKNESTYVYNFAQTLASQGYYVHVQNLGRSGAKTQDMIDKQLPELAKIKAGYITVTIGTNDAIHLVKFGQYEQNLNQIITALDAQTSATILLANSIDASQFPSLPVVYAQLAGYRSHKQNEILNKVLKQQQSKIKVIDLYGTGKLRTKENPAYYASDLFHPAEAGYAKWIKLFNAAVDQKPKQLKETS